MAETISENTKAVEIQLTPSAVKKIRETVQRQGMEGGLRLAVQGGGCSGLNYIVKFDGAGHPNDHVIELDGAKVFIDPRSLPYLQGMTLDYKVDLLQQAFVFHNPNAKQSCSCGTSFSV